LMRRFPGWIEGLDEYVVRMDKRVARGK